MPGESEKLKEFLLGNAPENVSEEIGVRIIGDPEFGAQMAFAEDSLIEDFLDDELTAQEKELFYANFLTTPERIETLKATALLRNYAQPFSKRARGKGTTGKKSGSFLDGLRSFVSLNLRPIAAVLVILVLAGVAWRIFLYDAGNLSPLEKEYAALNSKDLTNAPEISKSVSKALTPGTFRDTDGGSKLDGANLTENVLFRLLLPNETPVDAGLNLELIKGGQTVFRQTNLKIYQNPNGRELKVVLPKSILGKGVYQIKLSDHLSYGFSVE